MPRTFIIAEAGLNHGGSLRVATQLVDAARNAGSDAVKFQTFNTAKVLRKSDPDYELIDRMTLSDRETEDLKLYCDAEEIEFMSTPGNVEALEFLVSIGVKRLKIGSDDLTNTPLLEAANRSKLPVILSTGMATMEEVSTACEIFDDDLTVMHCTSLYPCPLEEVNLKAIETLKGYGDRVGYSDHTTDIIACCVAPCLGASVVEKHLKLDDHCIDKVVSVLPTRFRAMVESIRSLEVMMGSGAKEPQPDEIPLREKLRKSPVDWLRGEP